MNLCLKCLSAVGLKVRYPHMIRGKINLCDSCKEPKQSLPVLSVVEQLLITEKGK